MSNPIKKFFPHLAGSLVLASAASVGFIANWEEDKSAPNAQYIVYADKLAGGLPTVCAGITKHVSTVPVIVGDVWNKEQCKEQESLAIIRLQENLAKCFKTLPPQSVFDAATSHAWNNGYGATCSSLAMKAWNEKKFELGCRRLAFSDSGNRVWSYVKTGKTINGKPEMKFVQGLANRRDAEVKMCTEDLGGTNAGNVAKLEG